MIWSQDSEGATSFHARLQLLLGGKCRQGGGDWLRVGALLCHTSLYPPSPLRKHGLV